jgi:Fe2+ or Zn2+ uptake regulation protein
MHDAHPPAGPRLPKNHRLVNDVVREHGLGRHLTTADVHSLAKRAQPAIGFTTVYRALSRLTELGLVAEVRVPGADVTYYERPAEPHAHFRCEGCGRVDDIDFRLPEGAVDGLAAQYGIDVREALITLHGRCATCREGSGTR